MEILYNRGGTIADVHHLIDAYEEKARKVPRMYILHVGVNDILHGEQPAAIVEQLRLKWTDHKDALAICSIPEIEGRGKGIQAATMLLNAQLKKLCKNLKARFIDLSRDLKAEDAMERGRLHYKEDGVRNVVNRLGAVASLFLGIQWRRDSPTSKIGQQRSPLVEHREGIQQQCMANLKLIAQPKSTAVMHQAMGCLHAQHTDDPVNRWHAGKTEVLAGKPCDPYPVEEQRTDYQRGFPPLGPVRELERRTSRPQDIVHCLDSNMQLPPSQNSYVALGRAPEMDPSTTSEANTVKRGIPRVLPPILDTPNVNTSLPNVYTGAASTPRPACNRGRDDVVGFLNLQGARREHKWEELYRELEAEGMTLFGVAETHLRDIEEALTDANWCWAGRNRVEGQRRGGGVGVVRRSTSVWCKELRDCWDHIWVTGEITGIPVA
ncbi:hypothetical protein HPB47_023004, partial [Ixodes persulcatus]